MKITIDNKAIEAKEGQSILDAALDAGVFIPHLCSHPDLEAKGGCRLCSVEIEGIEGAVPACETEVQEDMVVTINGEQADRVRKTAMELILATHPADCTGCPKYGKCELQSMYQYLGVSPERWRKKDRSVANDSSNPLIDHLFTRCVRCVRCIRACQELRGVKVLDYIQTDQGIRAGIPDGKSLEEAGCRFCGACIEVCPTGSIVDQVGLIKEERSYADNVVPCRGTCPAHIDIPRYIRYIKQGDFDKATAVVREKVPFPETLGSICTHTCEDACKHNELGSAISVCRLKRTAAANDTGKWKERSKKEEPTGKKVAIIGAGPAGLTAGYYLAKKGHDVVVYEKNEKAGGQLRYGIPAYRLPDEVIDKEIDDIKESGLEILLNQEAPTPEELLASGYDSVLITVGTHRGNKLPLEGNDLKGVYLNTDFLKRSRENNPIELGGKVIILGGGNVAYDCARTAVRQGAKEVHVACLESLDAMTSTPEERAEGEEEGIILHPAQSFIKIIGDDHVEGIELKEVANFYFDENRRAVIELVEDSDQIIPVDNVIFAVGQSPENTDTMNVELTHGPYIQTDNNLKTSLEGVYAAGDVVTGTKSVIEAIAAGRKAAEEIDLYLGGNGDISEELLDYEVADPYIGRIENFSKLERRVPEIADEKERIKDFELVEQALSCQDAQCEAERCLQCDLRLNITKPKLWNEF